MASLTVTFSETLLGLRVMAQALCLAKSLVLDKGY